MNTYNQVIVVNLLNQFIYINIYCCLFLCFKCVRTLYIETIETIKYFLYEQQQSTKSVLGTYDNICDREKIESNSTQFYFRQDFIYCERSVALEEKVGGG